VTGRCLTYVISIPSKASNKQVNSWGNEECLRKMQNIATCGILVRETLKEREPQRGTRLI
jgi:hypothetical protein